jgi:transposase
VTTKRHALCDGNGVPLTLIVADGRRHDITQAVATIESLRIPTAARAVVKPRGLAADRGYDSRALRAYLRKRKIRHSIPRIRNWRQKRRRGKLPGYHPELSGRRWVVERLFRAFDGFRRLIVRYERHAFIYRGMLELACIMITLRFF